jgi:hypothetical protein
MKLFKKLAAISLPKTLALWGITIAAYAGVYVGLSALGHSAVIEGVTLAPSLAGTVDALYYSALRAFTPVLGSSASPVIGAVGTSQLVLSAGFFGLFVHKATKAAAPMQKMHYPSIHHHLNRILSKLYIFRYDVGKLLEGIEKKTLTRHHMRDLWITSSGVDTAMHELHDLISQATSSHRDPSQVALFDDGTFRRVIAGVDAAFWNLACLLEECSKEHIKWNYAQTVESLTHNALLAEDIIQMIASHPVEKEMLYSLREVQQTFQRMHVMLREKEDFGFKDLPDMALETAFEHQIEQDLKVDIK